MTTDLLFTWLSKLEAARCLGISERTLDRLVAAGKGPECRNRPRAGKKPEPVYNPQDVETLAQRPPQRPGAFPPALWLTIDQAAAYTGLSASFLRRLVRSGELPSVRDGATKVRRADLHSIDIVDIVSSWAKSGGPV